MAARTGVKEEAQPGSTLLVIHNFAARSGDELSLAKGERLQLIERDDDFGDGWFLGRHLGNGRTGLFPEVYTTLAPKPTLPHATQQRGASENLTRAQPNYAGATSSFSSLYRHSSASAATGPSDSAAGAERISSTGQPSIRTSLPAATSVARGDAISTASPVMNETLSVINEHMNDMNTPGYTSNRKRHSAGPAYTFIAGHETDDEENQVHSEEEVLTWSPDRVAEYLEDHGVEKAHCDVFKEQEISGEVLLAMDQSSLFLKEFALGSVGRRLKTWHKIRALQEEARQPKSPEVQRSPSGFAGEDTLSAEPARSRASTVGSALPRALDTSRQSATAPVRGNTLQPTSHPASGATATGDSSMRQSMTSTAGPEATWSPSAQVIRENQMQRRLSLRQSGLDRDTASGSAEMGSREGHRKQPSLDQTWRPGQVQSNGQVAGHSHSASSDAYPMIPNRDSSLPSSPNKDDGDKSYFSSTEVDSRSRTDTTPATSKTSADIGSSEISRSSSVGNRRSTYSSGFASPDFVRDSVSPTISQGIFGALNSVSNTFGSTRSATSPIFSRQQQEKFPPVVTKLDHSDSSDALANMNNPSRVDESATHTTNSPKLPFLAAYKPKMAGLRTISDAITRNEKLTASPKERESGSPAPTGSTSPSVDSKSIDMQKSEAHSRASAGSATNLVPPPANQRRVRVKPKKATSAYTRGLERKSPAEQMLGSDYSGWMKKKSGSLMTTWKTRLFVLRGRRLSYYYSDNDTEEKGLIDISFHRVLPAHNETLTGLHAAITTAVAGSNPTSPKESQTPTAAQQDLADHPAPLGEETEGMFIFKLVPPKSGLSKGVNFTKPTVHYFAVNSRQEGRLWMAALMKATIDRDEDGMVTTTYNQKTISLAKARARRERPPALMGSDDEKSRVELSGEQGHGSGNGNLDGERTDSNSVATGLGIGGLGAGGEAEGDGGHAASGAEKEVVLEDASSLAPSTALTTEPTESVNEKVADERS